MDLKHTNDLTKYFCPTKKRLTLKVCRNKKVYEMNV